MSPESKRRQPDGQAGFRRLLRAILLALLFAFAFGLVVGTLIRRELDKPVRYIGDSSPLAIPADPGDVRDVTARVLMPRDHEEQIG